MKEADINAHCTEIVNLMREKGIPPVNGVKIGYITGLQEALKFLEDPELSTLPGKVVVEVLTKLLTVTPNP